MTKGICLMTSQDWLAEWGHAPSCSARTCLGCSLQTTGTLWPESFTDWPQSATASSGGLFQRPPLVPATDVSGGGDSPTLPTPAAWDGNRGPDLARADRPDSGGMDLVTTVERLLPTPPARDHKDGRFSPNVPTNALLGREVWKLDSGSTPTPSTDGNKSWDETPLIPPTTVD